MPTQVDLLMARTLHSHRLLLLYLKHNDRVRVSHNAKNIRKDGMGNQCLLWILSLGADFLIQIIGS